MRFAEYFGVSPLHNPMDEEMQLIADAIADHVQDSGLTLDEMRDCHILRDERGTRPHFREVYNVPVIIIRDLERGDDRLAAIVYELAQEMGHYFINMNDPAPRSQINWIEETICEAMSVYFLRWFADNWSSLDIAEKYPHYAATMDAYARRYEDKRSARPEAERLSNVDLAGLVRINAACTVDRDFRTDEIAALAKVMDQKSFAGLLIYKDYAPVTGQNNLLMPAWPTWQKEFPDNAAVQYICGLCKTILERGNQ
ncbi:MAG: hypothetical protein IKI21_01830 [Oscillospiraceae bacterium]|nr:hypothetical protein [Oscillospiraceae bacterium]